MSEDGQEARSPATGRRRRWPLAGILLTGVLLAGAAIRGLYLVELAGSPETAAPAFDAAFHDYWARALLSGDWSPPEHFADPQIHTTPYFRPPAYPYFLAGVYAVTGGSPLGARAAQMVLGLVNVVLGYLLARALFGRSAGLWTALGMACYWAFPYFEGELLAPVLLVTLILTAALLMERWWHRGGWLRATSGGLLLGLLALARPNALVLAPVTWLWAVWIARRKRDRRRLLAALIGIPLGTVAVVAPATIRNYTVAGDFVPITSNAGVNLYIGNNEEADGYSARIPILAEITTLPGWTCFDQPALVRGVERLRNRPMRASEVSEFFAGLALDFIAEEPGATLTLAVKKAALFWGPAEISNNREIEIARSESPVLRWLPRFPWVLSLALLGVVLLVREHRRAPVAHRFEVSVLLLAIVMAYFVSHLPFFVAGRYRVLILPILVMFAAAGVDRLVGLWRGRERRAAVVWTSVWIVLLGCAHVPMVDYEPDRSLWHFQRGDAFRRNGEPDRAMAEYRLAIERATRPDALPHNNLGAVLLSRGRDAEAIAEFQKALDIDPGYLEARYNLALVHANNGRDDLACAELEEVLRLDPDRYDVRLQLGGLLLRRGRPLEALPHLRSAASMSPSDHNAAYLYGVALIDAGRPGQGRAALTELIRRAPRYAAAYVALAELAAAEGDRDGAVMLLQQALAIDPAHAGAVELLRRLR